MNSVFQLQLLPDAQFSGRIASAIAQLRQDPNAARTPNYIRDEYVNNNLFSVFQSQRFPQIHISYGLSRPARPQPIFEPTSASGNFYLGLANGQTSVWSGVSCTGESSLYVPEPIRACAGKTRLAFPIGEDESRSLPFEFVTAGFPPPNEPVSFLSQSIMDMIRSGRAGALLAMLGEFTLLNRESARESFLNGAEHFTAPIAKTLFFRATHTDLDGTYEYTIHRAIDTADYCTISVTIRDTQGRIVVRINDIPPVTSNKGGSELEYHDPQLGIFWTRGYHDGTELRFDTGPFAGKTITMRSSEQNANARR